MPSVSFFLERISVRKVFEIRGSETRRYRFDASFESSTLSLAWIEKPHSENGTSRDLAFGQDAWEKKR